MGRYEARATVDWAGFGGTVASASGLLTAATATQVELGGPGGATNPEELFAAAHANCFTSTITSMARARGIELARVVTDAEVRLEWSEGAGDHRCQELVRVARAGYLEFPSRLWEQQWSVQGEWAGFSHHHWLVDLDAEHSHVTFTFKYHALHGDAEALHVGPTPPEEQTHGLWWDGTFTASEQVFFVPEELHAYLRAAVVDREHPQRGGSGRRRRFGLGRGG